MNSGYIGWSRSRRAAEAESNGIMPATRAAKAHGFKSAAALRQCLSPSEWHHTSKYCNPTDYYNVPGAIEDADWRDLASWLPHLTRSGKAEIRAAIREKLRAQLTPDRSHSCHSIDRWRKHHNNWHRHVDRVAKELGAEPLPSDSWSSYSTIIQRKRGLDLRAAILELSAEQKRQRQQSQRNALAKRIRKALGYQPLDRSAFAIAQRKGPNGKTFGQRAEQLRLRHGFQFAAKIERRLRAQKQPLTDAHWLAAKAAITSPTHP